MANTTEVLCLGRLLQPAVPCHRHHCVPRGWQSSHEVLLLSLSLMLTNINLIKSLSHLFKGLLLHFNVWVFWRTAAVWRFPSGCYIWHTCLQWCGHGSVFEWKLPLTTDAQCVVGAVCLFGGDSYSLCDCSVHCVNNILHSPIIPACF